MNNRERIGLGPDEASINQVASSTGFRRFDKTFMTRKRIAEMDDINQFAIDDFNDGLIMMQLQRKAVLNQPYSDINCLRAASEAGDQAATDRLAVIKASGATCLRVFDHGDPLYPDFQFTPEGSRYMTHAVSQLHSSLLKVARSADAGHWAALAWWYSPQPTELRGRYYRATPGWLMQHTSHTAMRDLTRQSADFFYLSRGFVSPGA